MAQLEQMRVESTPGPAKPASPSRMNRLLDLACGFVLGSFVSSFAWGCWYVLHGRQRHRALIEYLEQLAWRARGSLRRRGL